MRIDKSILDGEIYFELILTDKEVIAFDDLGFAEAEIIFNTTKYNFLVRKQLASEEDYAIEERQEPEDYQFEY